MRVIARFVSARPVPKSQIYTDQHRSNPIKRREKLNNTYNNFERFERDQDILRLLSIRLREHQAKSDKIIPNRDGALSLSECISTPSEFGA
jgi:hypothetical protein